MSTDKKFAIGITIGAVIVFAVSFLPWYVIKGTPDLSQLSQVPGGDALGQLFGGFQITVTGNAWNGHLNLPGLPLPNWLVVLAAASLAAVAWLRAFEIWKAPAFVPFALAAYGLLHAGDLLIYYMRAAPNGSAGVGSLLTTLAFAGLLFMLIQDVRASRAAKKPERLAGDLL